MAAVFGDIHYIAPVETLAGYRSVQRYVRQRRIESSDVLVVCLRDDLAMLLTSMSSPLKVISRQELQDLTAAVAAANEDVAKLEDEWREAMKLSPFLWSIAWQWQAEYVLHLRTCSRAAEALVSTVPHDVTWLITPAGWMWGSGADQFGDKNPIFYLALQAHLLEARLRYQVIGNRWSGEPAFLLGLMYARLLLNVLVLVLVSLVNRLLGMWHAASPGRRRGATAGGNLMAFFHEPFSFDHTVDTIAALQKKNTNVYRVMHVNLFRVKRQELLSDLYTVGANLMTIFRPRQDAFIGRIDQRLRLSSWIFFYLHAVQHVGLRDYYQVVQEGIQQAREAKRLFGGLPWMRGEQYSTLSSYTRLIIGNYVVEYIFSAISLLSLLRQARPSLVVYPDGYSMIGRLAQVWGQKHHYVTAQVPHGYPNRTFPQYYYEADYYLTPSRFSWLQLQGLGRDEHSIRWVRHETVADEQTEAPEPKRPVIGLVYSGSYAYWSFPNLYAELFEVTSALIRELGAKIPSAQIILKSHPNGTSPYFFAALKNSFPQEFNDGTLTHISRGWAQPFDWQQLTAAVAPVIFPSTPTIQFLRSGIPLLFVPGSQRTPVKNIYYPHQRAVLGYPFAMASVGEAITYLHDTVGSQSHWQQARQTALAYARGSSIPPVGVAAQPLADLYASLINHH